MRIATHFFFSAAVTILLTSRMAVADNLVANGSAEQVAANGTPEARQDPKVIQAEIAAPANRTPRGSSSSIWITFRTDILSNAVVEGLLGLRPAEKSISRVTITIRGQVLE